MLLCVDAIAAKPTALAAATVSLATACASTATLAAAALPLTAAASLAPRRRRAAALAWLLLLPSELLVSPEEALFNERGAEGLKPFHVPRQLGQVGRLRRRRVDYAAGLHPRRVELRQVLEQHLG